MAVIVPLDRQGFECKKECIDCKKPVKTTFLPAIDDKKFYSLKESPIFVL